MTSCIAYSKDSLTLSIVLALWVKVLFFSLKGLTHTLQNHRVPSRQEGD